MKQNFYSEAQYLCIYALQSRQGEKECKFPKL